jgi:hypothetical protein
VGDFCAKTPDRAGSDHGHANSVFYVAASRHASSPARAAASARSITVRATRATA